MKKYKIYIYIIIKTRFSRSLLNKSSTISFDIKIDENARCEETRREQEK